MLAAWSVAQQRRFRKTVALEALLSVAPTATVTKDDYGFSLTTALPRARANYTVPYHVGVCLGVVHLWWGGADLVWLRRISQSPAYSIV